MWSDTIVLPEPCIDDDLNLFGGVEPFRVGDFPAKCAVEGFCCVSFQGMEKGILVAYHAAILKRSSTNAISFWTPGTLFAKWPFLIARWGSIPFNVFFAAVSYPKFRLGLRSCFSAASASMSAVGALSDIRLEFLYPSIDRRGINRNPAFGRKISHIAKDSGYLQ